MRLSDADTRGPDRAPISARHAAQRRNFSTASAGFNADEASAAKAVLNALRTRDCGTALLNHLIPMAQHMGFAEVVGVVLADNTGMLHLLDATDLHWSTSIDSAVRTMRVPLPADHQPPRADP